MNRFLKTVSAAAVIGLLGVASAASAQTAAPAAKPTIVLVHGAFADSSSWDGVVTRLVKDGYPVVAAANPLRGVDNDANYLDSVLASIQGPIVLVGHSYGGMVISGIDTAPGKVKALVYVDAFEPDVGESALGLSGLYPGSSLGGALAPVPLAGGGVDLYIQPAKFQAQFAADVPAAKTVQMAVAQRPVTQAALTEAAGVPAWKTIPSWSIYGSADLNIPPQTMAFMSTRAGAKRTVIVKGGSHVVMISHPDQVATLIEEAAAAK